MSSSLSYERESSKVSIKDASILLYGSQSNVDTFVTFQNQIANDPILKYNPSNLDLSRSEIFNLMAKKSYRYHELFDYNNDEFRRLSATQFEEQRSLTLHFGMFIPMIEQLGTPQQVEKWIPKARKFEIFGAYAQTELGQGSDVQGLETRVEFDNKTDEFVINTPSLTATKWWIGELGVTATHIILQAKLINKGQNCGIQTFIVPIRNENNHELLSGVIAGDIGPKYGFNAKDNGYAQFTNVRIPRDNMLMKYSKISKDGEFKRMGNEKIGYATMMTVRKTIIMLAPLYLAQVLTIAIRYSIVRKQFKNDQGEEITIMDYQLQMEKLITLLSDAYIMHFTGLNVSHYADQNLELVKRNDFSLMQPLHALLSGCKAVFTSNMLSGMERARQSCGGHGYSSYSGIPLIMQEASPMATYEGENTVLLLQTARVLLSELRKSIKKTKVHPFFGYLNELDQILKEKSEIKRFEEFFCPEIIRKILRFNAGKSVHSAELKVKNGKELGLTQEDSINKHAGIALVNAAQAHILYFSFESAYEKFVSVKNEALRNALFRLLSLFAINKISENLINSYIGGYLNGEQINLMRKAKEILLEKIRPDALNLIEGFQFSDNSLKSAIGCADGKAYERLFEWVKEKNYVNTHEAQQTLFKQFHHYAKL